MRTTHAFVQVASALLGTPHGKHWGYELSKASGVRSGVMYPLLARMLRDGWLVDGWEDPADIDGKRPPRRYYELTEEGRACLERRLEAASGDSRFRGLQLGWNA